jgi:hypothetical protein
MHVICTHSLCLDCEAKNVNNSAVYRSTHGIIEKIVGNESVGAFYEVKKSCVIWRAYIPGCLQLSADFYVVIINVDKINEFRKFRLDGVMRRDLDHFCYMTCPLMQFNCVIIFICKFHILHDLETQVLLKKLKPWLEIFAIEPISFYWPPWVKLSCMCVPYVISEISRGDYSY